MNSMDPIRQVAVWGSSNTDEKFKAGQFWYYIIRKQAELVCHLFHMAILHQISCQK